MPLECLIDRTGYDGPPDELYLDPRFPDAPPDRPYLYINMVSTVDGKTLVGRRGESARGVGEATDQLLMRRLEAAADAIVVGAGTVRASNLIYPPHIWRVVITRSGDLPLNNRFFTDAPDRAVVFAVGDMSVEARKRIEEVARIRLTDDGMGSPHVLAQYLRRDLGVRHALLEGGASTNFDFLAAELVDELFLSFTPKIKGGERLPTVVDGAGFPDREYASLQMLSLYADADELYLRYRVGERRKA